MKLQKKLSLGFLIVAACIAGINLAWIQQTKATKAHVDSFTQSVTPALTALGQIKSSGLNLVEVALYASIAVEPDAEEELARAMAEYDQWVAVYRGAAHQAEDQTFAQGLEESGQGLYRRAQELLRARQSGASETQAAALRKALHEAKKRFLSVINKPIASQVGALKQQRATVTRSVGRAVQLSLWTAVLILLAALGLGVFIAGTITRPVVRLSKDVQAVGAGDFSWRTPVRSKDEIGVLAETFNRMAESLERTTVSKRYVESIITSMADTMLVATPDGNIRTVNRAALYLLGYTEEELSGKHIEDLIGEDNEDGSVILARARFDEILAKGAVSNAERTLIAKDGRRIPVLFSGSTMRNQQGRIQGVVCVALDITARKQAEAALRKAYADLQSAQGQLVQSEKLAALGRFSAGIAHEVKNPLSIVLGGVEFLQRKIAQDDEDGRTCLEMINSAVHRADTIVRDLLKFSQPSPADRKPVAPSELVEGTLALLKHGGALKKIEVQTAFGHDGARVEVDKNQIEQVLLNIFMNAIDAMSGTGTIAIATEIVQDSELRRICEIRVKDTGEGIAPEDLKKLFEPFFTTKRDKKGTGLGLSISKSIVESNGGTIRYDSRPGQGTTAIVALLVSITGEPA